MYQNLIGKEASVIHEPDTKQASLERTQGGIVFEI
jgi:hypothetical protein